MSRSPVVTVGCAVYNGERTLERALGAIVAQDYPHLDIVISDDASTDASREICDAFARRDPRIRILRNAVNVGVTRNFNNLVHAATGEYFMWADQDDVRDPTFVRKALEMLEARPDAVLCHSHTGAFLADAGEIRYIITLDGIADVRPLVRRYWKFLRFYSDTVLYGLIRTKALRETRLYRDDLGSANALLFELLLRGIFVQVPEVLSYYSGRGIRNRPTSREEYARMRLGREMPWYYLPFLVLARNQADGILRARLGVLQKAQLLMVLVAHVAMVFTTKLVYRAAYRALFGRMPRFFTRLCDRIIEPKSFLVFVDNAQGDAAPFPEAWALKGASIRGKSER